MVQCLSSFTAGDSVCCESLNRHPGARLVTVSMVIPRSNDIASQSLSSVTSSAEYLPHSTTCSLSRRVTIDELSDKVLLNVFGYFLDDSLRNWSTLMNICRKWRHFAVFFFFGPRPRFASQRPLQFRLFCTHARQVLACRSTLPIVVQYGGSQAFNPSVPEGEDIIMAALKHSHRITSIRLTITSSLLEHLSTIGRPFSELEELNLLSRGRMQLTLPSAFRWGRRLRFLHLNRIVVPALLQLLYSSKNIVDLHFHEVILPFPPESLTKALSGMVRLRSLSLHVLSTTNPISRALPLPPREFVVLPALHHFDFQGRIEYLEGLVSRMEAPLLDDLKVTFSNTSNFDLPGLHKFTDMVGAHESHHRADILASELAVSISLTRPGDPTCLVFQLYSKPLREKLFFMARICVQFSAILCNVEELLISVRHSRQEDRVDIGRWLEPLNSFIGVKWLSVVGNLSTDIVFALLPSNTRRETVLPALYKLYIRQPAPRHAPLTGAVESLITSRRLSGHPIAVEYERRGTGTVYDQLQYHYLLSRFD